VRLRKAKFEADARTFVNGGMVTNPSTSMKLYLIAKQMRWAHLPLAGGLYDQHPELLDQWSVLFRLENEKALADHRKQQAEARRTQSRSKMR
jgi:hypothetical protein